MQRETTNTKMQKCSTSTRKTRNNKRIQIYQ